MRTIELEPGLQLVAGVRAVHDHVRPRWASNAVRGDERAGACQQRPDIRAHGRTDERRVPLGGGTGQRGVRLPGHADQRRMMLGQVGRDIERAEDLHRSERRARSHCTQRIGRRGRQIDVVLVDDLLQFARTLEGRNCTARHRTPVTSVPSRRTRDRWSASRAMLHDSQLLNHLLLLEEGVPLARMNEVRDCRIVWRLHSQPRGFSHDGAVQRVDLGPLTARQVLPHGRAILAEGAQRTDHRAEGIFLVDDRNAFGAHHGDDFLTERAHERHEVRIAEHFAAGETRERRRGIHDRVVEKLLPDRVLHIVNEVSVQARPIEDLGDSLRDRGALTNERGDLNGLDARAVVQTARTGVLDAVIRDAAEHAPRSDERRQLLRVANAVLEREKQRLV